VSDEQEPTAKTENPEGGVRVYFSSLLEAGRSLIDRLCARGSATADDFMQMLAEGEGTSYDRYLETTVTKASQAPKEESDNLFGGDIIEPRYDQWALHEQLFLNT